MIEATGSKRYCLHFPVRTRLIVFAVLKIIGDLLTITILGFVLFPLFLMANYVNCVSYMLIFVIIFIVIILGAFILFITDFVVTIILLYKMHKRDMKTIKRYYTFNFAVLVVTIMIALAAIGFGLYALFGSYLPLLAVQAYFLSLLTE